MGDQWNCAPRGCAPRGLDFADRALLVSVVSSGRDHYLLILQ